MNVPGVSYNTASFDRVSEKLSECFGDDTALRQAFCLLQISVAQSNRNSAEKELKALKELQNKATACDQLCKDLQNTASQFTGKDTERKSLRTFNSEESKLFTASGQNVPSGNNVNKAELNIIITKLDSYKTDLMDQIKEKMVLTQDFMSRFDTFSQGAFTEGRKTFSQQKSLIRNIGR